jgi:8-amino-7-oxononanoate synthase
LSGDGGPIVPLILGPDRAALEASARLRERGLFVQAIRPPTVPEGTARLRVTLSAAHTPADLQALIAALRALGHAP